MGFYDIKEFSEFLIISFLFIILLITEAQN
jgi:hypothetical protein